MSPFTRFFGRLVELTNPECAAALIKEFGGTMVAFPADPDPQISPRDFQLFTEFDGANHNFLARKYGVTTAHVYRVNKRLTALKEKASALPVFDMFGFSNRASEIGALALERGVSRTAAIRLLMLERRCPTAHFSNAGTALAPNQSGSGDLQPPANPLEADSNQSAPACACAQTTNSTKTLPLGS